MTRRRDANVLTVEITLKLSKKFCEYVLDNEAQLI